MATPWQKPEIKTSETENVIREYMEKMTLALENESARLKEQAGEEANRIVTRAREEADHIITKAKQTAQEESNDIMRQLKQDADGLLQESREKAVTEGRRAADEVIREAKEKAANIIEDIIEHGINPIEYDFIRAVSSAKNMLENEKSRLSGDAGKEVIIVEKATGESSEMKNLLTSINDSENKLQIKQAAQGASVNL